MKRKDDILNHDILNSIIKPPAKSKKTKFWEKNWNCSIKII